MKALIEVTPSPEQLALFSRIRPGVEIIRGAAGSGKTSTALLKLRAAVGFYVNRRQRQSDRGPVRVLVLTYNRTLRGYIDELANRQLPGGEAITLQVSTFSNWAMELLGNPQVIDAQATTDLLERFARGTGLDPSFAAEEAVYMMGRFPFERFDDYLTARRDGRGTKPRMERAAREVLLNSVVRPYVDHKLSEGLLDWNDLATRISNQRLRQYDVVVVDEAQDLSANEIRAVMSQLAEEHTVTFVLDSTQRIYGRSGFAWSEVGVTARSENSHRLTTNYRNTKQTAKFAAGLLTGMEPDDDGTMPDFESAVSTGELPIVVKGRFNDQFAYAINYINDVVDLEHESVLFLHVKGGGWFSEIREKLAEAGLPFVSITRRADWPEGDENIALSTIHSAKGLEFDHVILLGLNAQLEPDGVRDDPENEASQRLRRLIAMGIGRARKSVLIGYKPADRPEISKYFAPGTFREVEL